MEKTPSFIKRLNPNCKKEITYKQRDELMVFNTPEYWWCYFDTKTKKLYDMYCVLILEDATEYLLNLGCIDKNYNKLKQFIE